MYKRIACKLNALQLTTGASVLAISLIAIIAIYLIQTRLDRLSHQTEPVQAELENMRRGISRNSATVERIAINQRAAVQRSLADATSRIERTSRNLVQATADLPATDDPALAAAQSDLRLRAQAIQSDAWRLLASTGSATLDRIRVDVQTQQAAASQDLRLLREQAPSLAIDHAAQSFSLATDLLTGPSGIAAVVRQNIERQRDAETALRNSHQAIRELANTGSDNAIRAAQAQTTAVAAAGQFSAVTARFLGGLALFAFGFAILAGMRTRRSILSLAFLDSRAVERIVHLTLQVRDHVSSANIGYACSQLALRIRFAASDMGSAAGRLRKLTQDVSGVAESVAAVQSLTADTTRRVEAITCATRKMGNLTRTIEQLSQQTRMVAITAAIEATHAGPQGAGFGVIAEGMRELAGECAGSAVELAAVVAAIQKETGATHGGLQRISSIVTGMRATQQSVNRSLLKQSDAIDAVAAGFELVPYLADRLAAKSTEIESLCIGMQPALPAPQSVPNPMALTPLQSRDRKETVPDASNPPVQPRVLYAPQANKPRPTSRTAKKSKAARAGR